MRPTRPSATSAAALIALALITSALPLPRAQAASSTWVGNGNQTPGNAIWGGLANWTGNSPANGAGFTATFGNSFNNGYTVIVNTNRTIGNIVFTDPANANDLLLQTHPNNFTLTLAVNSGTPNVNVTQAGRTLTINPRIAGSSGLNKTGLGTLVLTNANTYGGTTTVNGGILRITNNNALGSAAAGTTLPGGGSQGRLELAGGIAVSGETLLLQGRTPGNDAHALSNFSGNNSWGGNINLTTGGNQYNIGSQADTLTIAGNITQISGVGGRFLNFMGDGDTNVTGQILNGTASIVLTKTGAGTLNLSSNNNYTGATNINEGVLKIGAGGTTGTLGSNSNTTIASGAELRIDRSTASFGYDYSGALAGSGTVNILAGRRMNFRDNNQTASGDLAFTVDGLLGIRTSSGVDAVHLGELSGSGTVQRAASAGGGATVVIGGKNTSSTFSGSIIANELSVEKVGSGMLTLGGNNTYGGTTLVSGGTLVVNGALTNTSSVTVASGGTLSGSGAITTTGNSTTIASGSTLAPGDPTMLSGTGTLSLNTSSLTFDPGSFWAVNIAGADHGRLQLNSPAALDLSGVSLVAGTTSFDPLTNTPYWILDNVGATSLSGMFANMTLDGVGANLFPEAPTGFVDLGGTPFAVFLNADFGGNNTFSGGNDILLFAIPEPSKAVLLALGLLGLLARRRR